MGRKLNQGFGFRPANGNPGLGIYGARLERDSGRLVENVA